MTRVLTTNGSQPHRLRQRLHEAGVQHGQQVEAEIEVRVEGAEAEGAQTATVFFCNMPGLAEFQIIGEPDGEELPEYAIIDGFDVDRDGYWRVPVLISPNGVMNVTVIGEPVLVGHEAEAPFNGDGWQGRNIRFGDVIGG